MFISDGELFEIHECPFASKINKDIVDYIIATEVQKKEFKHENEKMQKFRYLGGSKWRPCCSRDAKIV